MGQINGSEVLLLRIQRQSHRRRVTVCARPGSLESRGGIVRDEVRMYLTQSRGQGKTVETKGKLSEAKIRGNDLGLY